MSAATAMREKATEIAESAPLVDAPPYSLAAALVAALADLTVVGKGHTADAGSYKYDYADLADVVRFTRPVLASHGLVALTPVGAHEGGLACTVMLLHASGERMEFDPFPFPHGRDAQATGSMVTYHRRYALSAALGIATGDDDDGASAAPRQEAVQWTVGMSKQHLAWRLGKDDVPDVAEAGLAWVWGSGPEQPVTKEAADELADRWLSRPMDAEPAEVGA